MLGVTSRKERTAVYAGHSRGHHYDHVPRLDDMCIRVLIANIDAISFLGDVPFYIMEPVLSKCSSTQLKRIEDMNPVCIICSYFIRINDHLKPFHRCSSKTQINYGSFTARENLRNRNRVLMRLGVTCILGQQKKGRKGLNESLKNSRKKLLRKNKMVCINLSFVS